MSARQRFVANGKDTLNQMGGTDGDEQTRILGSPTATATNNLGTSTTPPLKDASNSPRPERRLPLGHKQNDKGSVSDSMEAPGPLLTTTGIRKPLNITSLARSKHKKTGVAAPNDNKKPRNSTVDRLKENEPMSHIRSPKPLSMSPSQRLQNAVTPSSLFGPSNSALLADNQFASPTSRGKNPGRPPGAFTAHTPSHRFSRIPPADGDSFTASGLTLMNAFSSPDSRSLNESLGPARREVFPIRTNTDGPEDPAHIRDSLSPFAPAQRLFSNERTYDYECPIAIDEAGAQSDEELSHNRDQHVLRRTTKRIGQHDNDNDETARPRQGKRAKTDVHANEIVVEQHIDLTYDRRPRLSRSSTPTHPHHPSADRNAHHPHKSQPTPQAHYEPQAQNLQQNDEDSQALYRLLGFDLERYFNEHVDQYEATKSRWMNCSIEEWQAGANQMSEKFSKVVDFVKEHMATKIKVYATLHDKVAQHKTVLGERQSMLSNMREKLVKDSGMVLGGAGNGTK